MLFEPYLKFGGVAQACRDIEVGDRERVAIQKALRVNRVVEESEAGRKTDVEPVEFDVAAFVVPIQEAFGIERRDERFGLGRDPEQPLQPGSLPGDVVGPQRPRPRYRRPA